MVPVRREATQEPPDQRRLGEDTLNSDIRNPTKFGAALHVTVA